MPKLKPQSTVLLNHDNFPFLFSITPIKEKIEVLQSQIPRKESTFDDVFPRNPLPIRSETLFSFVNKCINLCQLKQAHAFVNTSGSLLRPAIACKLLSRYTLFGDLDAARILFDRMPKTDLIFLNFMIHGFASDGDCFRCLGTFRELIKCGMRPDCNTLLAVIQACKDSNSFHMGRLIHCFVIKGGFDYDRVCGRLFDMYAKFAKFGIIDDVKKLFDDMPMRNLETWKIMIQAFVQCGNVDELLFLYAEMREQGISPNEVAMMAVTKVGAEFSTMNKDSLVHDNSKETPMSCIHSSAT